MRGKGWTRKNTFGCNVCNTTEEDEREDQKSKRCGGVVCWREAKIKEHWVLELWVT